MITAGPRLTQVAGAWSGWQGSTLVKLADGSYWKQSEYVCENDYAYRPRVLVQDGRMQVDGVSRPVSVVRLTNVLESTLDGSWNGWDGQTVVRLVNGSRWLQAEYLYGYGYTYRPGVVVHDGVMYSDGTSRGLRVRRVS